MRRLSKCFLTGALTIALTWTSNIAFATTYEIQPGDTFWKISQKHNVEVTTLMSANNANENTVLFVGDDITIPNEGNTYYTVKSGDTPWIISQKLGVSLDSLLQINGLNQYSYIYVGQKLKVPSKQEVYIPDQPKSYITYITHTVESGDDFWNLSLKYGIPQYELMEANNADSSTILRIGDKLKIPVHHVPVMEKLGSKYGEYLEWWQNVQYIIPIGAQFKVIDFYTGKSFYARRTIGANHADSETLTSNDTETLKSIWGGSFSWKKRPAILEYKGRRIACSVSAMPHAGNENAPAASYTTWRSGDYGAGTNYDYIKGNEMNGHFDIHFYNSTRHKDGKIDDTHQKNVKISAGITK